MMNVVTPTALFRSALTTTRRAGGRVRRRLLALWRRGLRTDEALAPGVRHGSVRVDPSSVTVEERASLRVHAIVRNESAVPWSSRGTAGVMVTAAWHDRRTRWRAVMSWPSRSSSPPSTRSATTGCA
jgi:hypothetical protein